MHSDHSPAVALTFDDGPDPDWTPLVLDALASVRARATFFVVAPRAGSYPSLLARMREEGHEVGFHCTEHVRHDAIRQEEIEADVRSGLPALGGQVRLWRTPWGVVTPATEEVARIHGLTLVGWTADTEDWRGDNPQEMLLRIESKLVPQAVVLMHDGIGPGATRGGCRMTVDLIAQLVYRARNRGLEPVPLQGLNHPLPDRNPDPNISRTSVEHEPLV
ncbi:MAG TPA: polysaccharide deacetylase family protein [Rubrobacter sp.]|nr:polysaccharide deacetylase family protein [Rubrobacter sp.]